MKRASLYLAALSIVYQLADSVLGDCPWNDPSLSKWDDSNSWTNGVPAKDEAVVVESGKRVLLNVQPPRLLSITIEDGGVLVWGNEDGITLDMSYILVKGEFHIGSEQCPFEKKADIKLYGKTNTYDPVVDFDRKFLGVDRTGVLEIHGKPKWSWTQLTATVKPGKGGNCRMIYDGSESDFFWESTEGLHVTVWNQDGSLFDRAVFATEHESKAARDQGRFHDFIQDIPNGKVIGVAVAEDLGKVTNASQKWEAVYTALESLGSTQIRKVQAFEPYACVAVKGNSSLFNEGHTVRTGSLSKTLTASTTLVEKGLAFTAGSILTPNSSPNDQIFKVNLKDLAFPKLNLLHNVASWQPGDRIVVASTDYKWRQAEEKTIVECHDCSPYQIRVDGEFEYTHFGEITYGIDERAEVGLLTRNIRIQGVLEDECYWNNEHEKDLCEKFGRDTFGGHTKILRGGVAHIEGAELYHMGQQNELGFYPLHCHMCWNAKGLYFRNNSIHETNSRCITIHQTDELQVSDNVCYQHLGHGIFLEDSAEQNNTVHRNLVLGTMPGTLLFSDRARMWCRIAEMCGVVSSFWITHPNNAFTDNVAAGSDAHGFVFMFSDVPLGPSLVEMQQRGLFQNRSTRYIPVKKFSGNTAHSNLQAGLWFDNILSFGQHYMGGWYPENSKFGFGKYGARNPPNEYGVPIRTNLETFTAYKNEKFNAWVRAGNTYLTNCSFADSLQGFISPNMNYDTASGVQDCIFIGETDNKGQGYTWVSPDPKWDDQPSSSKPRHVFEQSMPKSSDPHYTISGVSMYQGPVYVDNCYFDRYSNWFWNDSFIDAFGYRPVRAAAAISFHRQNKYTLKPTSGVTGAKFGYCDESDNQNYVFHGNETTPDWVILDGTHSVNFRDYDGSVTGVPNTQVVRDRPFFTGPECLSKPSWGLAICPYRYSRMTILGNGGVLSGKKMKSCPISIRRDDAPEDIYSDVKGMMGLNYVLRTDKSYTIFFNTTLGHTPKIMQIKPQWGPSDGAVIRFALCLPKETRQFRILGKNPKIDWNAHLPTFVGSLEDLDKDTTFKAFYWDSNAGYLYFKMTNPGNFTSKEQRCPNDACPDVTITRLDGGNNLATCTDPVPPYVSGKPAPPQVVQPPCTNIGSPEGLGAPVEIPEVAPEADNTPCPSSVQSASSASHDYELRGCIEQNTKSPDFYGEYVYLSASMTTQYCAERCFQRGYPYAGMHSGAYCRCAYDFGRDDALGMSRCNRACTGDKSQEICGGSANAVSVFRTEAPLTFKVPERCGPGNRGWVYTDGQTCLYVNMVEEEFPDAMRTCFRLGGILAKIDSQEKQDFLKKYLMGLKQEVWFGYIYRNNQWQHVDGSVMGAYSNWKDGNGVPSSSNAILTSMQGWYDWQWHRSIYYENKMALCDVPLTGPEPPELCGLDNVGWRRGSSHPCFTQISTELQYTQAKFACKILGGTMAPVATDSQRYEIIKFLAEFGGTYDYWVGESEENNANEMAYVYNNPHEMKETSVKKYIHTLCQLDDVDDIQKCPSGWLVGAEGCYYNSGIARAEYDEVSAYCNSKRSHVLRIDSEAENDFVSTLQPNKDIWLDLRYSSFVDNYIRADGTTGSYTNWKNGNPLQNVGEGKCARLQTSSKEWINKKCYSGNHYIVCEMPFVNNTP